MGVRLSELIASLSLAIDLGLGQPEEHVLRQTVIATRLAAAAGLEDDEICAAFYVSLLAWVGCVADSHEMSRWFGDDTRLRAASFEIDRAGIPMMRFLRSAPMKLSLSLSTLHGSRHAVRKPTPTKGSLRLVRRFGPKQSAWSR